VLSCLLPLLQEWKTTSMAYSRCCAPGDIAYFLTGNSWCVASVHTVWQWGWLPVAPFRRSWCIVFGCTLGGFRGGSLKRRVGMYLRGVIWRTVSRGFCRWFLNVGVRRWLVSWDVCRRLMNFIVRRSFVRWGIRRRPVNLVVWRDISRCISHHIVRLIWVGRRRTGSCHHWDSRWVVGRWFVCCMRAVCGRRVGRRRVSRSRLGRRGGGRAIIFDHTEFSAHHGIVSIWRAVLLI